MDEKLVATYKSYSLSNCEKLLRELEENKDDTELFFGGDMYDAYIKATEKAISKMRSIRSKIRNK